MSDVHLKVINKWRKIKSSVCTTIIPHFIDTFSVMLDKIIGYTYTPIAMFQIKWSKLVTLPLNMVKYVIYNMCFGVSQ